MNIFLLMLRRTVDQVFKNYLQPIYLFYLSVLLHGLVAAKSSCI